MVSLLPDPVAPDVIALDERFGPLSGLVTRLSALPVEKLLVYLVDQVDAALLPALGQQFHMSGLEGWRLADADAARRALIKRSIALHRKKGTPWAVKEALKPVGVHVEIIEQADQRAAYAALDPHLLNGSWGLDGAVALRALDRQTYIPQVQHWAQFIVRMNLAELQADQLGLIKALVDEWKPVSRHAIWQLWLQLNAQHAVAARAHLHARLPSTRLYPWENRSLSGYAAAGWRLGADGEGLRLDGRGFGFMLGHVHGAVPGYRLRPGRVAATVRAHLPVATGPVLRPEILAFELMPAVRPAPRLFWRRRQLDGGWRLAATRLSAGNRVGAPGFYLRGQRFFECRRLDGRWPVANAAEIVQPARLRLTGMWSVGGPRCPEFSVRRIS